MLDLLYLLVKFGYYDDFDDIKELIRPLMSLLEGINDKPFPEANYDESRLFRKVTKNIFYNMYACTYG